MAGCLVLPYGERNSPVGAQHHHSAHASCAGLQTSKLNLKRWVSRSDEAEFEYAAALVCAHGHARMLGGYDDPALS